MKNVDLNKYRNIAILGTVLMGVGSFMSCLSTNKTGVTIGTLILCVSIIISVIGFSKWQP